MTDNLVLLTGASGYLGGALARRYLHRGDLGLVLLVRTAQSRDDTERDLRPLAGRVRFLVGDLASLDPFADLGPALLPRITSVVHAAAVIRFNAELDLATKVNVEGTAKVVALARRCVNLSSFGLVSTVYATGLAAGSLREEPAPDEAGFANAYEWSKWTAERLVAAAADLPWRILRVSTVIADDDTGTVSQHNVFHHTLKLCFHGLLPLLPGRGDTPLYLVTSRFAVDAIDAVMSEPTAGGVYDVAPHHSEALTLDQPGAYCSTSSLPTPPPRSAAPSVPGASGCGVRVWTSARDTSRSPCAQPHTDREVYAKTLTEYAERLSFRSASGLRSLEVPDTIDDICRRLAEILQLPMTRAAPDTGEHDVIIGQRDIIDVRTVGQLADLVHAWAVEP